MQTQSPIKTGRQLVYMVVGRPVDTTYTEQANVLLFTTNDREVAEAKADEQNRSQNTYLFEVVDTELVTKQTIIEDKFIAPIVQHLQEFTQKYKFITSEDLTNAIDQLFFSEEVDRLLNMNDDSRNNTDSSNNNTGDEYTPMGLS